MSTDGKKEPPPHIIPVEGQGNRVNFYHTPFTAPTSQDSMSQVTPDQGDGMHIYYIPFTPPTSQDSMSQVTPVYTSGGGGVGSGLESGGSGNRTFVSYDMALGRSPGMTTCTSCQQQVLTNVTYKAGTFAWVMCSLFIFLGLIMCLLPFYLFFFWKKTKDVYHTCPHCNRVLHVEKKQCCK